MALRLVGDALARLRRLHPPGSNGHEQLSQESIRLFKLIETRAGEPAMLQAAILLLTMACLLQPAMPQAAIHFYLLSCASTCLLAY